jgi:hypothetical protein
MSNLRFAMITIALFAVAFAGMAWASKGFPLPGLTSARVESSATPTLAAAHVTPAAPAPAEPKITHETMSVLNPPTANVPLPVPNPRFARAPGFEDSVKQERKELAQPKSVPSAKSAQPELPPDTDPGRNRLRQTAIQAANAYAYAPCDPAIKAAFVVATTTYIKAVTDRIGNASHFATAQDKRVRDSIQSAFVIGGITSKDFPAGTQTLVAAIAKTEGTPTAPCAMGRQADQQRRQRS